MIPRRRFGRSEVELSTLCFGTMRLPKERSDSEVLDLLLYLVEGGVTSFHSSTEYDTFPRFAALLGQLRSARPTVRFEHIVKLAAPHFGSDRFDPAELVSRLDEYRGALATDRIDVVQWMVRFDLKQEARRLEILRESTEAIGEAVAGLKAEGRVGAFACFPYTTGFAEAVTDEPWCAGLVDYLNVLETERVVLLHAMLERGLGFAAIRPLAGGRMFEGEDSPADDRIHTALAYCLRQHAATCVVLSVSSQSHADVALRAVEAATA